jgi:hypothetical protein
VRNNREIIRVRPWLAVAIDNASKMMIGYKISTGVFVEYPDLDDHAINVRVDACRLDVGVEVQSGGRSFDPDFPYRWREQFDA